MEKLCKKCKKAMNKIGVKIHNLELVDVYKCIICGRTRTKEAKDLAIKSSPIWEEKNETS